MFIQLIKKKNEKIYIAGKISGEKNYKKKFFKAEKKLKQMGYAVMNPAILPNDKRFFYHDYIKISLKMLDACDSIYMLEGWQNSNGAKNELKYAFNSAKKIYFENKNDEKITGKLQVYV